MQGLTEENKTGSVEDIYEEFTTGADLKLGVVNPKNPVIGETKEIPKGSKIELLIRVTPPVQPGSILYSGFWKNGETEYWVTLSEEEKNKKKDESKTMEGGKRRKSRKIRSKSKRRHNRKN